MPNITLTKNQWARISEILGNGGLLVLGSAAIPFLLDKSDLLGAIRGLSLAIGLWYASVVSARKY